ncbi:aminodeoxychorismate lyase [Massilia sp. Root418]|uniref:endolytic transglycosylase MltG n=1 Tax=Massilia sp. Root418 TaxID=1736532 RepID=UPI0006F62F38|nr:endolytic transglycosylase MltG [Massilia sp. Root418]KQX01442.1 aminodeoxychorismate lyase [Massilia sp. Root418]
MSFIKKTIVLGILAAAAAGGGFAWWAQQPIITEEPPIDFTIVPGSGAHAAGQQIAEAGIPIQPLLFNLLARFTQKSSRLKAGAYELKPGTTPLRLIDQLVRGEFAQEQLTIIEGWTFRQMRQAVAAHKGLKHDTIAMSDSELMALVSPEFKAPEGLFFPDTYLFAKGSSELAIFRQAHAMLIAKLSEAWEKRDPNLPYKNPYEALTMASIVEKETGQKSERNMIAGVFVNRLRLGMLLQTDPTVIYGMGAKYDGKIRKKDLETDTPYNTYTRAGLPPTPIALPGVQSLTAALAPAKTGALYFVSRGNGTSQFSDNLTDHNRAVNQYQR